MPKLANFTEKSIRKPIKTQGKIRDYSYIKLLFNELQILPVQQICNDLCVKKPNLA